MKSDPRFHRARPLIEAICLYQWSGAADVLWSFVGKKANRQWVWIAMATDTRQIIAFHVGDRSRQSAQALWGVDSHGVSSAGHVLYWLFRSLHGGHSLSATPSYHQAGTQDQSRRTLQLHITTTSLPAGARHIIVLEETGLSYRGYQVHHLPLQPHQMCSLTWIALPGCDLLTWQYPFRV